MALPLDRPRHSELTLRVMSAAVLLPVAAFAIWQGGAVFASMMLIIAGALGWELARLCGAAPGLVACVMASLLIELGVAYTVSFSGAVLAVLIAAAVAALLCRFSRVESPTLLVTGIAYVSTALLAIVWLRFAQPGGTALIVWMVAIVVATDVGAYFAGRTIGGPKLAPRISPAKTWSGLGGGVLCAAIAGAMVSSAMGGNVHVWLVLAAAMLAVVAQVGDLIESGVKRAVGVKDASNLIPGHGGVLDRLDGFLTVAPATVLMTLIAGGSPLEWQ